MLKVQGPTWTTGAIQVVWSALQSLVVVNTYAPGEGWRRYGGPWRNVRFQPGDLFGARALLDGTVFAFKNGSLIGTASVAPWSFAARGGQVGIVLAKATDSRIGAFGGGNVGSLWEKLVQRAGKPGAGEPDVGQARPLAFSIARPNPTAGNAVFSLDLPHRARVSFAVYDVQGRQMWKDEPRSLEAGRFALVWNGAGKDGQRVAAGVYLARVGVDGVMLPPRRFTVLR